MQYHSLRYAHTRIHPSMLDPLEPSLAQNHFPLALTATLLVLSGCVAEIPESDSPADESERGNIIGGIGETATITLNDAPANPIIKFSVTDIETDPVCTGDSPRYPENGHFVAIDIEAQTAGVDVFDEGFSAQDFQFNPFFWKFVDADGRTASSIASGPSFQCLSENDQLPDSIGASADVSGTLILDLPSTEDTLIFEEPLSGLGFEWEIPG